MSNIYLFYWDPFFTELKLKTRTKEFALKHGKENIFHFSTKDFNVSDTISGIRWWGLFTTKKLVIVHGLPQDTTSKYNESTKEQINQLYDYFLANKWSISEDNLIIFHTSNPDKKTKWTKYFLENSDPQIKLNEYKADKKSITQFIQSKFPNNELSGEHQDLILLLCNGNMYLVDNETNKIQSYLQARPNTRLTTDLITQIVSSSATYDVRSFLDGIILDKNKKSTQKLINFAHADNNEFQFLWLLYRSIWGIINLINAREHRIENPAELAKYSKLPPFTVSRYLPKKNQLLEKKEYFYDLYHQLVAMDHKLKTGLIPSESFWTSIYGFFGSQLVTN